MQPDTMLTLADYRKAWHVAVEASDADPADGFAALAAAAAANRLAAASGHAGHGWFESWQGLVCKECVTVLEPWKAAA